MAYKNPEDRKAYSKKWYQQKCKDPEFRKMKAQYQRERNQTPSGRAVRLIMDARARAKRKGINFNLKKEWGIKILEAGRCQVSGIKFDLTPTKIASVSRPNAPSLDRINPKKGYTRGNCQIVIWAVNQAKGIMTMKEYKKITEKILEGMNNG